ncbi:MAG TPA: chromosomal replication initiator protein DnaA, partial [Armatimonadota bacterium]|nr:chromosomal replication initiator protein DnaA [Armatimonadota bacterium]
LSVSNATARTWIDKKYGKELARVLTDTRGEETRLEVVVQKGSGRAARPAPSQKAPEPAARASASAFFAPIPLNEKYTFDNFVVGQSNRFAHAAATAVAESPGREYNPLFIYGGVGLGKTHLLQAIGHALRAKNPRTRVAYVSGETFTSHFVTSLRERREEEFRRSYRSIDIWLVDDIQFIADKAGTKEEFFHTFNELYLTNRQIVLAADRPPRELRLMEDRLRTRLESGLMMEITPPELETRMAILQKRAELEGAEVPPDVVYQIACTVTANVRILEAALIRMLALASLGRCPITAELAARALGAFVQEGGLASISFLAIQKAVCDHFKITEQELTGPRRDRHTSLARQVAMYLMRELSRKSLSEIGQLFGGKAHSTVLYSCSKLEREMEVDPALGDAVRSLRARVAGNAAG